MNSNTHLYIDGEWRPVRSGQAPVLNLRTRRRSVRWLWPTRPTSMTLSRQRTGV